VESTDGLTMRTAPCAAAPAIQQDGQDIIIPQGASFKYLDRNSRQSDDCRSYGLWLGLESFCWVLGSYAGTTGWVPVQTLPTIQGFTSGLCTYTASDVPTLLVSDGGSSTGCAQLTPGGPQCFPADAVVTLRNGDRIRMSQLDLGAEIAVRNADGSVGYDAVYAFGHRDDHTVTSFVELVAELAGDATRSIQVGRKAKAVQVSAPKNSVATAWCPGKLLCIHVLQDHSIAMLHMQCATPRTRWSRHLFMSVITAHCNTQESAHPQLHSLVVGQPALLSNLAYCCTTQLAWHRSCKLS